MIKGYFIVDGLALALMEDYLENIFFAWRDLIKQYPNLKISFKVV